MTGDRLLLATDLDRTLIPNGPQPESANARGLLGRLLQEAGMALAFVSGRHLELVERAIEEYRLPRPDFVIGDVGTTVYEWAARGWRSLSEWQARLESAWGGVDRRELLARIAELPGITPQDPSRQNRHKLSFFVETSASEREVDSEIRARLAAQGVRGRIVRSHDELAEVGLLDVLPQPASKRHALETLIDARGFSVENTVFCGDSGNDLEVLASAIPSVLVANASEEVRSAALQAAEQSGHGHRLYLARGGFHGLNGNYAAGIMEGLVHYHPSLAELLDREAAG